MPSNSLQKRCAPREEAMTATFTDRKHRMENEKLPYQWEPRLSGQIRILLHLCSSHAVMRRFISIRRRVQNGEGATLCILWSQSRTQALVSVKKARRSYSNGFGPFSPMPITVIVGTDSIVQTSYTKDARKLWREWAGPLHCTKM
jgi:hypothetical protein